MAYHEVKNVTTPPKSGRAVDRGTSDAILGQQVVCPGSRSDGIPHKPAAPEPRNHRVDGAASDPGMPDRMPLVHSNEHPEARPPKRVTTMGDVPPWLA